MTEKKQRICRVCKKPFFKTLPLQIVCSPACAIEQASATRAKAERMQAKEDRKTLRIQREKLKTRRDYLKEAQRAFNDFIRARDKDKPCICCGQPLGEGSIGGAFDCGHYRSVGSAPHLRFDERNAHGQRKQCNRYGAGRAVDYRIGLGRRLGMEVVEQLESDNTPQKWTKEDLIAIRDHYRAKRKALGTTKANQ